MSKSNPTSFNVPKDLVTALKQRSYELSAQRGERVTASALVVEALLKFGIKPVKSNKS